jgi:hypothetical protein
VHRGYQRGRFALPFGRDDGVNNMEHVGTIMVDSDGIARLPHQLSYAEILAMYSSQDSVSLAWDIMDPVKFNPMFTTI